MPGRPGRARAGHADGSRNAYTNDLHAMTHVIAEPCIGTKDTSCVDVCPVDCIHPTKDEAAFETADQLYIDPDTCIDCGLCVDECPVRAIFAEEDLPAEWSNYVQINLEYYQNS